MGPLLREAYQSALRRARTLEEAGDLGAALLCLQRAHILGAFRRMPLSPDLRCANDH